MTTIAVPDPPEPDYLLPVAEQAVDDDGDLGVECQEIIQGALDGFKSELSDFEVDEFSKTTSDQVKRKLLSIQRDQEQRRKLRGLSRMQLFIEKIGIFDDICTEARKVVKLLHGKGWKKTFEAQWHDYRGDLKTIIFNFESESEFLGLLSEAWKKQRGEAMVSNLDEDAERPGYDQEVAQRLLDQMPVFKSLSQRLGELSLKDMRRDISEESEAILQAEVWKDIRKQLNDHVIQSSGGKKAIDELLRILKQLRKTMMDQFQSWKDERKGRQRERVLKWLSPPGTISQASQHEVICDTEQAPGTGSWITKNKIISDWFGESPECSLLWLNAKMGAGKTVLASHIIKMCGQDRRFTTSYFYCCQNDENLNSRLAVLKSILWQMAGHDDDLLPVCDEKRAEGRQESLDQIKIVQQLLERFCESDATQQFVVIDGLDECKLDDRETIIGFWMSMVEKISMHKPSKLRVLLVSRDMADIRNMLKLSINTKILDLDPADTNQDIEGYLEWVAPELQKKFRLSEAQKRDLLRSVFTRAEGMKAYLNGI
ncbi:hypothetical protein PG989_006359 [Apiospora arundinis]